MDTDDGIPLNKRGSGVRRLVLVSFFKAEAERRLRTGTSRSIIYAIEEPETAQHPNNQRILIESFKTLALEVGCQVLLTTHSPGFASELPTASIRFVTRTDEGPAIQEGADVFGPVAETLGVVPDSRVKVLFCVEGPTDVSAFKHLSRVACRPEPIPAWLADQNAGVARRVRSLSPGVTSDRCCALSLRPLPRSSGHNRRRPSLAGTGRRSSIAYDVPGWMCISAIFSPYLK